MNTISVSNSLYQAPHSVGPDLGADCLQRLSAEDTSNFKEDGKSSGVRWVEPFINGKNINGYMKGPRTVLMNYVLPIKMAREKFQRKRYFFHENDSRFYPQVIRKSIFLIGQVPIAPFGANSFPLRAVPYGMENNFFTTLGYLP